MITAESSFVAIGGQISEAVISFKGLSGDPKPIGTYMGKAIENGSSFFEMDTQTVKFYDASTDTWI